VVLIPLEPAIYLSAPNGRWFLVRPYGTRTREPALPLVRNPARTSSNHLLRPTQRKETRMTARPSNKATIDGVTRFIAYQCDHGKKKPHDRRCAVGAG
jgi:hypothetical protein